MNLELDMSLAEGYKSGAQCSRVITEEWVGKNMFCPRCGNLHISHFSNNRPVADFYCPICTGQYELKSKNGSLNKRVSDGAYATMIERITSSSNPDFMFLRYSMKTMCVADFIVVPKHFFVPAIIEERPSLAPSAKRAGWKGCNILLSNIPEQGRIAIIRGGVELPRNQVIEKLNHSTTLAKGDIQSRGWLFDVLNCVNELSDEMSSNDFTLPDIYRFEKSLSEAHQDNHNVQAKIRQQLQMLRDAGYIEFLGHGKYRRLR